MAKSTRLFDFGASFESEEEEKQTIHSTEANMHSLNREQSL